MYTLTHKHGAFTLLLAFEMMNVCVSVSSEINDTLGRFVCVSVYICLYCAKHWFCTKRPIAYTVPCHMNVYVYINEHQNNNVQTKGEKERGMHCDDLQFLLVPIWMDDSLIIIKLNHKNKAKRKHSHKWKRTSIINSDSAVALNAAFISFYRSFVPFHPAYLWHAWIPNEFTTR